MLTSVRFQNCRVLADVTIPLEPFTVLVGPNGSGKSTVLTCLDALATRAMGHGAPFLQLVPGAVLEGWIETSYVRIAESRAYFTPVDIQDVFTRIGVPRLLGLSATAIRADSDATDPDALAPDGGRFAIFLSSLIIKDRKAVDRIATDLRRVVPNVVDLRAEKVGQIFTWSIEMLGVGWVKADAVSEGTAIALALLAVLQAPDLPNLLLIEDLDRGLHPRAQREVIRILQQIVEIRPGLQIIATTHSPYLVDEFPPEAVVVLTLDETGHGLARRLSEHPKFEEWKDAMNAGELWAWVGEDWIRERPSVE